MQLPLVAEVAAAARAAARDVRSSSGGGLRTEADVDAALEVVDEVLLGTAAIEDPGFLAAAARRHPGRVGVSLDLRGGRAAVDGWLREGDAAPTATPPGCWLEAGASRLVVTETSRDGTLAGPDLARPHRAAGGVPGGVPGRGRRRRLARRPARAGRESASTARWSAWRS